jgi:hypothetical protein
VAAVEAGAMTTKAEASAAWVAAGPAVEAPPEAFNAKLLVGIRRRAEESAVAFFSRSEVLRVIQSSRMALERSTEEV